MNEVDIKFETENIEGAIAVGSYLIDAAKRLGINVACDRLGLTDTCAMMIKEGGDLLTEPTKAEHEVLGEERLKGGERLACQTKITASGAMLIKTHEEKVPDKTIEEQFQRKFEEMPLEEKAAVLLRLETIAFGDTFGALVNSPYAVVGKVMDVMAKFGLSMDKEAKDAVRPEEHQEKDDEADEPTQEEIATAETEIEEEEPVNLDEPVEADYTADEEDENKTDGEAK